MVSNEKCIVCGIPHGNGMPCPEMKAMAHLRRSVDTLSKFTKDDMKGAFVTISESRRRRKTHNGIEL